MTTPILSLEQLAAVYTIEHDRLFENLLGKLNSHKHLILTAEQGWGLKEYVHELGFQLKEENTDIQTCFIDIKSIYSSASFLALFAATFSQKYPEESSSLNLSKNSLDALKIPSLIARKKRIRIAVFLANSHLFHRFKDSNSFLRRLKLSLRNQKNCIFCLYGDIHPKFRDLIHYPGPLSGLGRLFELRHDQFKHRSAGIRKIFHDHNKSIGYKTSIQMSYSLDHHPYYLKLLSWHALIKTHHTCTPGIVEEALKDLILHFDHHFSIIVNNLTQKQLSFLKAMMEGNQRLFSEATRRKYQLGSTSNVARIKLSLENKEYIYTVNRDSVFSDPIFREWLRKRYF